MLGFVLGAGALGWLVGESIRRGRRVGDSDRLGSGHRLGQHEYETETELVDAKKAYDEVARSGAASQSELEKAFGKFKKAYDQYIHELGLRRELGPLYTQWQQASIYDEKGRAALEARMEDIWPGWFEGERAMAEFARTGGKPDWMIELDKKVAAIVNVGLQALPMAQAARGMRFTMPRMPQMVRPQVQAQPQAPEGFFHSGGGWYKAPPGQGPGSLTRTGEWFVERWPTERMRVGGEPPRPAPSYATHVWTPETGVRQIKPSVQTPGTRTPTTVEYTAPGGRRSTLVEEVVPGTPSYSEAPTLTRKWNIQPTPGGRQTIWARMLEAGQQEQAPLLRPVQTPTRAYPTLAPGQPGEPIPTRPTAPIYPFRSGDPLGIVPPYLRQGGLPGLPGGVPAGGGMAFTGV
jgi:hypothetical protein